MFQPSLPSSRLPVTDNYQTHYSTETPREENYADSIRVFRRSFKRLMDPAFLSGCCDDLRFSFENPQGEKLRRNPSSGDLLQIENEGESGTFRITRAIYRNSALLEKEWYQLRGEQIAGSSDRESVISFFFQEKPAIFDLTLIREGRLVYIRMDAPAELLPKHMRDQLCEHILDD